MTARTAKRRRRSGHYGEGSIFERGDGRWVGQIQLGIVDGTRKVKSIYGTSREDVQEKLADLRELRAGGISLGRQAKLGEYLDRWFKTLKPRPQGKYSPTTLKGYADIIRIHLKPHLGHVRLDRLGPEHVEQLQDAILGDGRSSQTALNARNVLRGALKYAIRQRPLRYNPVELVDAPPASRGTGRTMEADETPRFLAAIAGHRFEAAFLLELACGLRRSEVLGLEWAAVDLRPGQERIWIRQGLHRVKGVGLVTLAPKTARGNRTLALPRHVAQLLRDRQEAQIDEQVHACERWGNTLSDGSQRLVFTTLIGTPQEPAHYTNALKGCLREAGLGHLRGHDLRHSASSILQARGLPPLATMEVLGHASPDVTMGIYGHLLSASRRQAAQLMDAYLDEAGARRDPLGKVAEAVAS